MKRSSMMVAVVVGFLQIAAGSRSQAAGSNSSYQQLGADTFINGGPVTLLSATLFFPHAGYTYVQSDGRYYPYNWCVANTWIEIDGSKSSNDSLIDWSTSSGPAQHSFNAIAGKYLASGYHTITLRASSSSGGYYVGAGSNLSIVTDAAGTIVDTALSSDSGVLTYDNDGTQDGTRLPSHSTMVSQGFLTSGAPVIAMTSGRSYRWNHDGDALWGIYLDGLEQSNSTFSWTNNDMYAPAELQAPMFGQAYFTPASGSHSVSLEATAMPYMSGQDLVAYIIGAGTRLITLRDGMTVVGSAYDTSLTYGYKRWNYKCIAADASMPWPGCPTTGSEVVIASANVTIPSGHNGVVFFEAKTRIQGDTSDVGGNSLLYLKINGVIKGSTGVQQLNNGDASSQRTLCASYLSAGAPLPPGTYTVQAIAKATGSYHHLSVVADLPLIWFD